MQCDHLLDRGAGKLCLSSTISKAVLLLDKIDICIDDVTCSWKGAKYNIVLDVAINFDFACFSELLSELISNFESLKHAHASNYPNL